MASSVVPGPSPGPFFRDRRPASGRAAHRKGPAVASGRAQRLLVAHLVESLAGISLMYGTTRIREQWYTPESLTPVMGRSGMAEVQRDGHYSTYALVHRETL